MAIYFVSFPPSSVVKGEITAAKEQAFAKKTRLGELPSLAQKLTNGLIHELERRIPFQILVEITSLPLEGATPADPLSHESLCKLRLPIVRVKGSVIIEIGFFDTTLNLMILRRPPLLHCIAACEIKPQIGAQVHCATDCHSACSHTC